MSSAATTTQLLAISSLPQSAEAEDVEIWQRALTAAAAHLGRSQAALIQAQRLEAIGQLAAGVAHEINTPVQYVADNVAYVAAAFDSMRGVLEQVLAATRSGDASKVQDITTAFAGELDGFLVEVPHALAESIEGLDQVASIVSALRSFSHPSRGQREPFDLNQALTTTITVARNEWRYLADVVIELDPALPPVVGIRDELGQVFLNLIVNAAHAVAAATEAGRLGRGTITVSSRFDDDLVVVQVADTGAGTPDNIRLALAHAVVVDKHGGTLRFDSEQGRGTTFTVTLPLGRTEGAAP